MNKNKELAITAFNVNGKVKAYISNKAKRKLLTKKNGYKIKQKNVSITLICKNKNLSMK